MPISRRNILSLVAAASVAPPAWAAAVDPFSQRSIGSPKAPVTAIECFSLTCPHCAHFATAVMPDVKAKLVDTGKLQIIYHDYPLDQIALMAAQVARSLPPDEYYPFIEALFASQDDWAYRAQQTTQDYQNLIFKYAALAGMDRTDYNAALTNQKLADFITSEESYASQFWHVDSTPSFVINGTLYHGNIGEDYNSFAATVASEAAKK